MAGATQSERAAALQEAQAAFEAGFAAFYRPLSADDKRALNAVSNEVWQTIVATGLDSVADAALPAGSRALIARFFGTLLPLKQREMELMSHDQRAAAALRSFGMW